jgi:hypothetical protein
MGIDLSFFTTLPEVYTGSLIGVVVDARLMLKMMFVYKS